MEAAIFESVAKIADKIGDLLKFRHDRRREFFREVIEPLFKDLTTIHDDYMQMFGECLKNLTAIERGEAGTESLMKIAVTLTERRILYSGMRLKTRAIADAVAPDGDDISAVFLKHCGAHLPEGRLYERSNAPQVGTAATRTIVDIMATAEAIDDKKYVLDCAAEIARSPVDEALVLVQAIQDTVNDLQSDWADTCEMYAHAKVWSLR